MANLRILLWILVVFIEYTLFTKILKVRTLLFQRHILILPKYIQRFLVLIQDNLRGFFVVIFKFICLKYQTGFQKLNMQIRCKKIRTGNNDD